MKPGSECTSSGVFKETTEKDEEETQEAGVSLAAAKEFSVDAAV